MKIEREKFLDTVADSFSAYYDLHMAEGEQELPLVFRADYYSRAERYWLTKNIPIWGNETNEFAYVFSAPAFDQTLAARCIDYALEEALPLVRRFYRLGFNIEATEGTAAFLKRNGIRTRVRRKLSDGSNEILTSIQTGFVSYILNTQSLKSGVHQEDGIAIRRCAVQNGVNMFTSLDTARILLDALEEVIPEISTIHR